MRGLGAGIGLISLLIGVAIVFFLFTKDAETASQAKKNMEPQAQQIAGRNDNGENAMNDVQLVAVNGNNGALRGVQVASIVADSSIQKAYGLQTGDIIVGIGPQKVREMNQGVDGVRDQILYAYQHPGMDLEVDRQGKTLTLHNNGPAANSPIGGGNSRSPGGALNPLNLPQ